MKQRWTLIRSLERLVARTPRRLRRASYVSGLMIALAACQNAITPSPQLLSGNADQSLYDRVVTDIEDSGLPLPSNASAAQVAEGLLPGDVLQVGYYLVPQTVRGEYRVGVGDVLSIDVADHPDLSMATAQVAPDGQLSLKLLGTVRGAGETIDSLASRVKFLYGLEKIKDPRVTVAVVERHSGAKQFIDQMLLGGRGTIITATVLDDLTIQLPLLEPTHVNRGMSEVRAEIRGGYRRLFGEELDVVVNLSERLPRSVYVLGQVGQPNAVPLTAGMTPIMAVASAGGLTKEANPRKIVLIRFNGQNDYKYWLINMKEGLTDLTYDGNFINLAPNDIVFVPQSAIDEINVFIEKFVKTGLPVPLQNDLGLRASNNGPYGEKTVVLPQPGD